MNRDIFEGTLTANNIVISDETVVISYPKAAVKDGISGSLGTGESTVKLVEVEEGYSLALIQAPKGTKVYYSLGYVPTTELHISNVTCLDGTTMLSLPTGDVYLLIVAPDGEECDYQIDFTEDNLQIQSVSQTRIPINGKSFVRVHGSLFSSYTEVRLQNGVEQIPVSTYVLGDNDIWITIDGNKLSSGNYYDLQVLDQEQTKTLENAFWAIDGEGRMELSFKVIQPDSARVGRLFNATLEYENTGDIAMPAPVFVLNAPYRTFIIDGKTYEGEVKLYGLGAEYPYGYVQPGVKQKMTFQMKMTSNNDYGLSCQVFHAGMAGAKEPLDLESLYPEEYLEYLEEMKKDIRQIRQEKGLTMKQLCDRAHVSSMFISRLERKAADVDNITLGNALKVSMVLGLTLDEFYDAAKAVEPIHKAGNPNMVKGQKQEWRKKKDD